MAPKVYNGSARALLVSFDIGTTYSGISYSILDPGTVPAVKGVTRFPDQQHVQGASKIPTVIYYDRDGNVKSIGANTAKEGVYEQAEDQGWIKVSWFKLLLRPNPERTQEISDNIPPLPPNKNIIDVFSDYLKHLYRCAIEYILQSEPNGTQVWESLKDRVVYIMSHPNGWQGRQQNDMREAAIRAGLVTQGADSLRRVCFVTEGEASLHYSIGHGLPDGATKRNDGVAIVDAGGGTIDISVYSAGTNTVRKAFQEIAPPQCHFKGAIVTRIACKDYLEAALQDSRYGDEKTVEDIAEFFDKSTKLRFRDANDDQYIRFGGNRDNDPEFGIRYGQLKLQGSVLAGFFEPSVRCIIDSIRRQQMWVAAQSRNTKRFSHVVLVGGFAANDYLFKRVETELGAEGYNVIRPFPDNHVSKAVADGAISFYLDRHVTTVISKLTYGQKGSMDFKANNPDHARRPTFQAISGEKRINNVFWVILAMHAPVPTTNEIRRQFYWEFRDTDGLSHAKAHIFCCRGISSDGVFMDDNPARFPHLCTIEVDISHLVGTPAVQRLPGRGGGTYYKVDYEVIMMFGEPELKVELVWKERGIERRSEARIIYLDDIPPEEVDDTDSLPPIPPPPAELAPSPTESDARSVVSSGSRSPRPPHRRRQDGSSRSIGGFRSRRSNSWSDEEDGQDRGPIDYGPIDALANLRM